MTASRNILALALIAATAVTAADDPFEFKHEDLLLGFQATSGQGSSQNLFLNLGSTVAFRDGANQTNLGNIGADLELYYGANWFERANLHFGVYGNRSNLSPTLDPGTPPQDPGRVVYLSRATTSPGTALSWTVGGTFSTSALAAATTSYAGLKDIFLPPDSDPIDPTINRYNEPRLEAIASGATVLDQNTHPVSWNNSWSKWNPVPGAAFNTWSGGIQNEFGKGGSQVLVDVQRVTPNTHATYVVTIAVTSSGDVLAISGSASTPFEDWIATFPSLTNPDDKLPGADPDNDGYTNDYEFAFGGSPVSPTDNGRRAVLTVDATGNSQRDLTLTVEVLAGATFAPSGNKLVATAQGVNYTIEGSLDLNSFDSQVLEVTPHLGSGTPKDGYQFKTFRLVASAGLTGKGFLRAGAELAD